MEKVKAQIHVGFEAGYNILYIKRKLSPNRNGSSKK